MRVSSERLVLRDLKNEDADIFYNYRSDKELCQFQDFMVSSIEETKKFIKEQSHIKIGQEHQWKQIGIALSNDLLIGDCAIQFTEENPKIAEIGCTLSSKHHNKGYATEALRLLINHVFEKYPIHKIKAMVDIRNFPSQRMVEKIGFTKEGHLRKHYWDENQKIWVDELQFGLLQEEWNSI